MDKTRTEMVRVMLSALVKVTFAPGLTLLGEIANVTGWIASVGSPEG